MNSKLTLDFFEEVVSYRDFLVDNFMNQMRLFLDWQNKDPDGSCANLQLKLSQIDEYQRVIEDMVCLGELQGWEKILPFCKEYSGLRDCVENLRNTNIERGAE